MNIVNSTNFESKPHKILSRYSKPHVAHTQMPNLKNKKKIKKNQLDCAKFVPKCEPKTTLSLYNPQVLNLSHMCNSSLHKKERNVEENTNKKERER
jgi:hypothetical protein